MKVPADIRTLVEHYVALGKLVPHLPAIWHTCRDNSPGIPAATYDNPGGTGARTDCGCDPDADNFDCPHGTQPERQALQPERTDDWPALRQELDRWTASTRRILDIATRNNPTRDISINLCTACGEALSTNRRCTNTACTRTNLHADTKTCANPNCNAILPPGHPVSRCRDCYPTWKTSRRDRITTNSLQIRE